MKRLLCIFFVGVILFILCITTACSPVQGGTAYGKSVPYLSAIPDKNNLYYDVNTRIVYIMFCERDGYNGYGYLSPYYAENGLPYRYDANDGRFVMIESTSEVVNKD